MALMHMGFLTSKRGKDMAHYDVKGRNVLITGASMGIGKALSENFAKDGANLFLGSLPGETKLLRDWAEELKKKYGAKTWTFPIDLSTENGPENLFEQVRKTGQTIDILVNNAGVLAYGLFHEVSLSKAVYMVHVNVIAYMKLMHLFLPELFRRKGRIFNVSSVSAFQACCHHAVYGCTKAFVQNLSEAVEQEIARTGVRVFTLNPSYTRTNMTTKNFPEKLPWYYISGYRDPEKVAQAGYKAFKRGKRIYITGIQNRFIHTIGVRTTPRLMMAWLSMLILKGDVRSKK